MSIPDSELPNVEEIRALAEAALPSGYRLHNVYARYGSLMPPEVPDDFEVVIEYSCDEGSKMDFQEVGTFQSWAHALVQDIRSEWPPDSVRISFSKIARTS